MFHNGYYQDGNYYFYVRDHLGNNRLVTDAAASVVQSNHYYPFGMSFAESTNQEKQPYKYNNKELDDRAGLNWYDYSARMKDDWGFTTPDPHSENYYSWSPYVYVGNNPMRFIDPTGMDWVYRVVDGEVEVYYDRSVTSQDDVNVKYGSDGGVTHLTTGSTLTKYQNGEVTAQYTFTNDAEKNKDGSVTDMYGNTLDNSTITSGSGYSIFGTSDGSVNAETLYKNRLGSSYIGENNPKTYKGRDSYQYYPRGKAEQAAYQHDLDYDKLKASGLTGAFLTASTYKAYKDLLERCQAILGNPSSTYRDREQAARILGAFGPITASKYVQYTINNALINKNQTIGTSYMNSHISPSLPYMP